MMKMAMLWCVSLLVVLLALHGQALSFSDEKMLIKHLLSNYRQVGLYGRPVTQRNASVDVQFGATLIAIDRVWRDQAGDATAKLSLWHNYAWDDAFLKWNPDDFGGVDTVRVPINRIWRPDMKLFNSLDINVAEDEDALAVVRSSGSVLWIPPASVRVRCNVTSDNVWECPLKYGSWSYDLSQVNINFYGGRTELDLSFFWPSRRFTVLSTDGTRNEKKYPCCEETYGDLTFVLKMESSI